MLASKGNDKIIETCIPLPSPTPVRTIGKPTGQSLRRYMGESETVERLGFKVPMRKRKNKRVRHRLSMGAHHPIGANATWAVDFQFDTTT